MRIAFDITTMQVGCPIVQVIFRGDARLSGLFDVRAWAPVPTENMKLYEITKEELEQLVAKVKKHLDDKA